MEPVINPMFFYLLSTIDNLNTVFVLIIIALTFGLVLATVGFSIQYAEGDKEEKSSVLKLPIKRVIAIYASILLVSILLPSKSTLIEMEVARNVTYDRVEKAVEIGKDIKNTLKTDIMDIIKAATKEKKQDD